MARIIKTIIDFTNVIKDGTKFRPEHCKKLIILRNFYYDTVISWCGNSLHFEGGGDSPPLTLHSSGCGTLVYYIPSGYVEGVY